MKKNIIIAAVAGVALCGGSAMAFNLSDLFGGDPKGAITNMIQGVLSTDNLEVADLAGTWTVDGSAVSFKSENFLQKAGGIAAAGSIEAKLDPYYKQYGLTGGVFEIQEDGTFTFKMKKISLSGEITKNEEGNFDFAFKALGKMNLGKMTAFVEKSPSQLQIMFDASKLQNILALVSQFTGSKLASTATSILKSYDGICVGFKCQGEGKSIFGGNSNSNNNNSSTQTESTESYTNTDKESNSNKASSGANALFELIKKGKK